MFGTAYASMGRAQRGDHSMAQDRKQAQQRGKERGATALSYGLVLGLVAFGGIAAVTRIGESVDTLFGTTSSTLVSGVDQPPSEEPEPVTSPEEEGFSFTSHLFSTCLKAGPIGPTQQECRDTYVAQGASWAADDANYTVNGGYQLWTVPETATYQIRAVGAQGGANGGNGALVEATFSLTQGEHLLMVVGQVGLSQDHDNDNQLYGGGGGASTVALGNDRTSAEPLLVAAGGHGDNEGYNGPGGLATQGTTGNGAGSGDSKGGCSGGFYTSGGCGSAGQGFRQGSEGGQSSGTSPAHGGFGGASGTYWNGSGAGGGYDGGSGTNSPTSAPSGVQATSYISPSRITEINRNSSAGAGAGTIRIQRLN